MTPLLTGLLGIEAAREAIRQARGHEAYPQTPILFANTEPDGGEQR